MTSRARRPARGSRPSAERSLVYLLLGAAIVLLGVEGFVQGPKVVRQVWSAVGVHRVEAHAELLRAVASESRVDACLLAGLMYVESRGQEDAVSSRGALGLFQLVPAAASDAAQRLRVPAPTSEQLLLDPLLNARLAANHLAWLYVNEGPDLERVLVAYNAGRGKLRGWIQDAGGWSAWRARHAERGDSECLAYARTVIEFAERFRERGVIAAAASRDQTAEVAPAR